MKFTNPTEIDKKEILKFNSFLITEYTYRACMFAVQKFQKILKLLEKYIKNSKGNKEEDSKIIVQKLFIKNPTGQKQILKLLYKHVKNCKTDNEKNTKIVVHVY